MERELNFIKKDSKLRKEGIIVTTLFIFILVLYVSLKILNRLTYPDFVFSKIHIQPDGLIWLVLLSLVPVIIAWIPRINFRWLFKIQSILIVSVLLMIAQNFYYVYKSEWQTFKFMIAHPKADYGNKMRYKIGSVFYNYALFINKYTPENAAILIPPQAFPWPQSGNVGMLRYFVYPRNISNGDEFESPSQEDLKKIDYVLLNWGEADMVESPHTHDWPKFDVKAEKIIFMNEDGSFAGEVKGDYHYKDYKGKKVWGIIVTKH